MIEIQCDSCGRWFREKELYNLYEALNLHFPNECQYFQENPTKVPPKITKTYNLKYFGFKDPVKGS